MGQREKEVRKIEAIDQLFSMRSGSESKFPEIRQIIPDIVRTAGRDRGRHLWCPVRVPMNPGIYEPRRTSIGAHGTLKSAKKLIESIPSPSLQGWEGDQGLVRLIYHNQLSDLNKRPGNNL